MCGGEGGDGVVVVDHGKGGGRGDCEGGGVEIWWNIVKMVKVVRVMRRVRVMVW